MARKPRKKTTASVKAAADRAEMRSKGEAEGLECVDPVLDPPEGRDEKPPHPGGRPTKYKQEFAKKAQVLCENGATDADLADFFNVTTRTIQNWASVHPEFFLALKTSKAIADGKVERALFQKAVGFEHDTVKIMQYEGQPVIIPYREKVAPDTTACIFWLKNRDPQNWRDKTEVKHDASEAFASLWQRVGGGTT